MLKIIRVTEEHLPNVQELFQERATAVSLIVSRQYGMSFDVNALLEQETAKIQQYYPPSGC